MSVFIWGCLVNSHGRKRRLYKENFNMRFHLGHMGLNCWLTAGPCRKQKRSRMVDLSKRKMRISEMVDHPRGHQGDDVDDFSSLHNHFTDQWSM